MYITLYNIIMSMSILIIISWNNSLELLRSRILGIFLYDMCKVSIDKPDHIYNNCTISESFIAHSSFDMYHVYNGYKRHIINK